MHYPAILAIIILLHALTQLFMVIAVLSDPGIIPKIVTISINIKL